MTRANKLLVVLVVVVLGVGGCAKGPANRASTAERVRALEERCAKLEKDYSTAAAARDQARSQAAALEAENAQLQKEAAGRAALTKERDDLRQQAQAAGAERDQLRQQLKQANGQCEELQHQVAARSTERDLWAARHDRFKKAVLSALQQDDPQAQANPNLPTTGPGNGPRTEPTPDGPAVGGQS
jgi:chromosome segregation ATPase